MSLQNRLGAEMKTLTQQQIRETLADSGGNYMLKYDGTTKVGENLTEVEIATGTETLLTGTLRVTVWG